MAAQKEAAQRLVQRQALREAENAKLVEEAKRRQAEMELETLREGHERQKRHLVALQERRVIPAHLLYLVYLLCLLGA